MNCPLRRIDGFELRDSSRRAAVQQQRAFVTADAGFDIQGDGRCAGKPPQFREELSVDRAGLPRRHPGGFIDLHTGSVLIQ